jgi:hypothetical protein
MKNRLFSLLSISSILLTGCASYRTVPLDQLSSEALLESSNMKTDKNVLVTAKAFDKLDCKRYLDRDVIAKGYQPVQLYIENHSDKNYLFSLDHISLPHARPEEVARTVHTSTVGRILAYGIPGLFLWPFVIPAVVDGLKSSESNDTLDMDFYSKTAATRMINAGTNFNKLIFVPNRGYQPHFNITLIEQESKTAATIPVSVN